MSAPSQIALIGFHPPFVKGGSVVVHIHHAGGTVDLIGSTALMASLAKSLAKVISRDHYERRAEKRVAVTSFPIRRTASATPPRHRPKMPSAQAAAYAEAHALWLSGKAKSQSVACRNLGLNPANFAVWLMRERAAGALPYTKPNGKLL